VESRRVNVRERLTIYRRAGVTTLRVEPVGATPEARLASLGRLMDLVKLDYSTSSAASIRMGRETLK
jgi:hypothetical protein